MGAFSERYMTRREFLRVAALVGVQVWALTSLAGCLFRRAFTSPVSSVEGINEARYYSQLQHGDVRCELCFRKCVISEGKTGFCLARKNKEGRLYTLTYGNPVAVHIDPVEKEPMFHMKPGSDTLCVGTAACNLRCKFCINWQVAWKAPEEVEAVPMTPAEVVQTAIDHDVPTICFTYNDPIQQYEFMFDIARLAKEKGLRVSFHSNGSINREPLKALLPYMDSVAIDLKAFDPEVYRRLTEGELEPVLSTLRTIKEEGIWLEVVCLLVPGWNDNMVDITTMCIWLKQNLGEETVVHFSRFFPTCELAKLPPTPLATLEQAHDIAREAGLHYVYIGNVPAHDYANTYCPKCDKIIVERKGLLIQQNNIVGGKCQFCGREIPGIWEK